MVLVVNLCPSTTFCTLPNQSFCCQSADAGIGICNWSAFAYAPHGVRPRGAAGECSRGRAYVPHKLAFSEHQSGWALPPQCRPKRPASSHMRELPLGNPCTELLDQLCLKSIRNCPDWVCPLRDHESGQAPPSICTWPGLLSNGGGSSDLHDAPMRRTPYTATVR